MPENLLVMLLSQKLNSRSCVISEGDLYRMCCQSRQVQPVKSMSRKSVQTEVCSVTKQTFPVIPGH